MEDAMAIRELALYCVLAGVTGAVAAESVPTPEAWTPTSHCVRGIFCRLPSARTLCNLVPATDSYQRFVR